MKVNYEPWSPIYRAGVEYETSHRAAQKSPFSSTPTCTSNDGPYSLGHHYRSQEPRHVSEKCIIFSPRVLLEPTLTPARGKIMSRRRSPSTVQNFCVEQLGIKS